MKQVSFLTWPGRRSNVGRKGGDSKGKTPISQQREEPQRLCAHARGKGRELATKIWNEPPGGTIQDPSFFPRENRTSIKNSKGSASKTLS